MTSDSIKKSELHYLVFQGLFMLGFMFHHTEEWDSRPIALFSMISLSLFILIPRISQFIFLTLLVVCAWTNFIGFPNLANHTNVTFFLSLFLIPYHILYCFRPQKMNYEELLKTVRYAVLILYFFTLFHKLNWDFLDPEVSCANRKLSDYFDLIPLSMSQFKNVLMTLSPTVGLVVEGAVPILLFFSKTRFWGLFFVVLLHFTLAPMGFTDFSSFAMALAWCFMDPQKLLASNLKRDLSLLIAVLLIMSGLFGITRYPAQIETYKFLEGTLFVLFYSPFVWKYFRNVSLQFLFLPSGAFNILFLILFFTFGFSNYLGLRTAGTFSMFSNLTTEGKFSNHILLGSNPFKIFGFQNDVVEIIAIDPLYARFYRKMPDIGQKIPRIEFSRILDVIRERGLKDIEMTIRYNGVTKSTLSAGYDTQFEIESPYWQKKLFKFRHIQPPGERQCLW